MSRTLDPKTECRNRGRQIAMQERFAFVGCYSGFEPGQLGWVGSGTPGEGITSFLFDEATGHLTATGHVSRQQSPTWLEPSPCNRFLIATHELSHHTGVERGVGFLTSYRIGTDGTLSEINTRPSGGRGNTAVSFDRTCRFLLTTRYWDGGVSALRFDQDTGEIGDITAQPDHVGTGPHPTRQSSPHPHGIHGDPRTDLVYAMDLGTDRVCQYILDQGSGDLTPFGEVVFDAGSGPRGLTFHPSLRVAYVNCELDGTVVVCSIDDETGLSPVQTELCYPTEFQGQTDPANLGQAAYWGGEGCVSTDGRFYYYICRVHQSIAVFDIEPETGALQMSGRVSLMPNSNARKLCVDPSGRNILVASQDANCIESFQIDPNTGMLTRSLSVPSRCPADVTVI